MRFSTFITAAAAGSLLLASGPFSLRAQDAEADDPSMPTKEPALLAVLPEICRTPDGMAMDADGNIILTCPNYGDKTHPAVLMKIDKENNVRLWMKVPVHPDTKTACPMGIEFGPGGELFIVDNQGWAESNGKGRILRVEFRDGFPVKVTVVAYGMTHPNGVRVRDGHVYVTQSLMAEDDDGLLVSGVYRFKVDDSGIKIGNTLDDPNLLTTIKTLNPDVQYGADGLVFDSKGNLFVANFGDATLHKIVLDEAGNVASNEIFNEPVEHMKSIDGICIDADDNIYAADFSNNAVCVISPDAKVRVLAKSPDCDGSQGGLDQPGEPIVRGNELIVSNFDMVTGPDKLNSGHDSPQTLSVIPLDAEPAETAGEDAPPAEEEPAADAAPEPKEEGDGEKVPEPDTEPQP